MLRSFCTAIVALSLPFGNMAQGDAAVADDDNPALKYHTILAKRPEPGYLFDRFYNAWLDRSTTESLHDFLQSAAEKSNAAGDRLLLGFYYAKQADDATAIEHYAKALENEPDNAAIWFYRTQAEGRTLDFEKAVTDLQEA